VDWFHQAEDTDQPWVFVNIRFHKIWEISCVAQGQLASQGEYYILGYNVE
jgi:hypothetical protein